MSTNRKWIRKKWGLSVIMMAGIGIGCANSRSDVSYLGDPNISYYRGHATEIDYPAVDEPLAPEVVSTGPPVTVRDKENLPIRDITLQHAVQTSLMNSQIIRSAGTFLSTGNALYTNPNNISSVYDPAIQESGVLFGGRGVEAALSAFDAQFQTSMIWGRDEQAQNNTAFGGGLGAGAALTQETGAFTSSLSKSFGHGGSISLNHNVNYRGTNAPSLFPSAYTGNLQLQYQLPLLAGAGTEFTRIAGPIGQSFGGISGVSQGVVIARINNDITLANFETSVRNLVKDVEDAYWDLYLAYQLFDVATQAKNSTDELREYINLRVEGGAREFTRADLHQAEDQYYAAETAVTNARSSIYELEVRLRRLMGLPVNDGEILRPQESPVSVELIADWYGSLTEALTQRVELRQQKWNIKSLQLQLRASESLTRPRLDFVGGYQVNGFGDDLLGYNDPALGNYYQTVTDGDYTGWNLGLQMRWDIGFRSAKAQVQNYELRLAKALKVLQEQEEEISHELAISFQDLARTYQATELSYNRMNAVGEEIYYRRLRNLEVDPADLLLRAIIRKGEAQNAYYQNLVGYNKAITTFQLRKGTLLRTHGVILEEGGWDPAAYEDAKYNSDARLYAKPAKRLVQEPEAFAGNAPFGGVYFANQEELAPTADPMNAAPMPVPPAETVPMDMAPMDAGPAEPAPAEAVKEPKPVDPGDRPAKPIPPVEAAPNQNKNVPKPMPKPMPKQNKPAPAPPAENVETSSTNDVFGRGFIQQVGDVGGAGNP
ncbi:TolC family protein [Thalassoglobus polymorphus]|uniref:Outer membrane efflux protein n=1 Tax=Thalassoglobus polymorphus TaxID=2527994 RepID=A0A517QHY9_9PLAN|nr:TolC family protein [Thalassoglobus polymorphus]QDT31249.1 Outer membrane efflux protein [Thalassoglobus polymorphus]